MNTSSIHRGRGLSLSLLLIGQIHRGSVFWLVITFFLTITSVVRGFNFNNFHQQLFYFTSISTFNKFLSLLGIKCYSLLTKLRLLARPLCACARVASGSFSSRVWSESGRTCPSALQHLRCRRRPCLKPSPAHRWRRWRTACCCSRSVTHL